MDRHTDGKTCIEDYTSSAHKKVSLVCDRNCINFSGSSVHQDDSVSMKYLLHLYESIPEDYHDMKYLNDSEFYNTIEMLKKTSKELRKSTNTHTDSYHSNIDSSTYSPVKKIRTKKKNNRKSILASKLNTLPSLDSHKIPETLVNDVVLHKHKSSKQNVNTKIREMHKSKDIPLIDDFDDALSTRKKVFTKDVLRESVTSRSASSKTPESLIDAKENDLIENNNMASKSKKPIQKNVITQQQISKIHENICQPSNKLKGSKTAQKKKQLKKTSASPIYLATRPNVAATLRTECGKKKIKELNNNYHYSDRIEIPSALFDWEIRKSPSWKALTLNETHKKLLAVKLATRKAEQALLKREYELNMEIMRERVKSAPLLFERSYYWANNSGKIKHNCLKACDDHQYRSSHHTEKNKFCKVNSCIFSKRNNKCTLSNFLQTNDTNLENKLHSIQLSEKHNSSTRKNVQNNCKSSAKICKFPTRLCHHQQDAGNCKKRCENKNSLFQSTATIINESDSSEDLCSLDKAYL